MNLVEGSVECQPVVLCQRFMRLITVGFRPLPTLFASPIF